MSEEKKPQEAEIKNEISIENQHFVKTKEKLDKIGPGMC